MRSLTVIIKELSALPKGDVYKKVIKGRTYYYHQFFEYGRRFTIKLSDSEAVELKLEIEKRKLLEKELKAISLDDKGIVSLSKSARNLSGYVMSEDKIIAEFEQGVLTWINEKRAPLIIKRTKSITDFLNTRVIDTTRVNSRLLRKALNIHEEDESLLSLYSYAQSISDNYWFKPKHSKVKYKDICFNNDIYFDLALKGDTSYFPGRNKLTPEITTTGSFEKGWKKIDSHWWLYKQGTKEEIFSELVCSKFAALMNIATVNYEYEEPYIKCQNFAEQFNFEPLISIAGDNDQYENTFRALSKIKESLCPYLIKLFVFDCVTNNVDRHNENCGLLRDRHTGDIIKLAPNFDNNLALISRGTVLNSDPSKDGLIKLFVDFLNKDEAAKKCFMSIDLPIIKKEEITLIINSMPLRVETTSSIDDYIYNRYIFFLNLKQSFNNKHN